MKTIYENTVKGVGDLASAFAEEKTIILFGDSAPDTLKDYCYSIDVKKADEVIAPGQVLEIDGKQYKILLTGHVMQKNLEALGHISISSMVLKTVCRGAWSWKRRRFRCFRSEALSVSWHDSESMLRKKIQVTVPGGIHMAVAVSLGQIIRESDTHVFLKSGRRMVSGREIPKVLALGVHQLDWVELIVDGEEEESAMERIGKLLGNE